MCRVNMLVGNIQDYKTVSLRTYFSLAKNLIPSNNTGVISWLNHFLVYAPSAASPSDDSSSFTEPNVPREGSTGYVSELWILAFNWYAVSGVDDAKDGMIDESESGWELSRDESTETVASICGTRWYYTKARRSRAIVIEN